jgi:hypothetical protein
MLCSYLEGLASNQYQKDDALKASSVLKIFVEELIKFGYPIRPTTHAVIHIPEDIINFDCGSESLSAFVFDNFYLFFLQYSFIGE